MSEDVTNEPLIDSTTEATELAVSDEPQPSEEVAAPTVFILMNIEDVAFELPSPSPLVWLKEKESPHRRLAIPIGLPEAQSLASFIHQQPSSRPSTHELFASALADSHIDIVAIRITNFERGVYFAELDLLSKDGRVVLDCRPSDAVNLAMRQKVPSPILCDDGLLNEHAVRRR